MQAPVLASHNLSPPSRRPYHAGAWRVTLFVAPALCVPHRPRRVRATRRCWLCGPLLELRWLPDREGRPSVGRAGMEIFVQQLINGITLGSIYGLIAIGYTMVFG